VIEALLRGLGSQGVALAVATCAVLVLRRLVARRFGVGAGYLCWLAVPVALAAGALPRPEVGGGLPRIAVARVLPDWAQASAPIEHVAATSLAPWIAAAWLAGAGLLAASMAIRQRRFAALLRPGAGGARARLPAGAGPAVVGLLRPRIALPADFEARHPHAERRLMLRHERVHLARGDNRWNLLAAALLVVHWFNPLAWIAWRCVRADQELSCDAAVLLRAAPGAWRAYADALLKVQGVSQWPPLSSSWQSFHPLVERVRMLPLHRLPVSRQRTGRRIALAAIVLAGLAGHALRSTAHEAAVTGQQPSVMMAIEVGIDGRAPSRLRMLTRAGERGTLRLAPEAGARLTVPLTIAYLATPMAGDQVRIESSVSGGETPVLLASPKLVAHVGHKAAVVVRGDAGAQEVRVSFVPTLLPAGEAPAH